MAPDDSTGAPILCAMPKSIAAIQELIAGALNALPGVFSTVQWGGRAYKLPGPNGNRKKPRLLAHVWLSDDGDHVGLSFKLQKKRAEEVVDQFGWITPHSFRTLAPSGWITAEVRTKAQCRIIAKLLAECRAQFPVDDVQPQKSAATRRGKPDGEVDVVTRRIEAVVRQKRAEGWSPAGREDF
jgi:hypothetical protein